MAIKLEKYLSDEDDGAFYYCDEVDPLLKELEGLRESREKWMKNEPFRYFNESTMTSVPPKQWEESKDFQRYYTLPLFLRPLPAQQVPDFLEEIIELIEGYEHKIEGEWGVNRSIDELIKSGEMPDIYYKLVKLSAAPKPEDK